MFMAVDPGGTIGWVLGEAAEPPELLRVHRWGEVPPAKHQTFLNKIQDEVGKGNITVLIVENFRPTGGVKTWQPDALEQIGALKYIAGRFGIEIAMQNVGDAKAFCTPAKEQPFVTGPDRVGKGGRGHARMALKHLITWRWLTYYG